MSARFFISKRFVLSLTAFAFLLSLISALPGSNASSALSQSVSSAVSSAASLTLDSDDASALSCFMGVDRHYGFYVCTAYSATYLGYGWYRGYVYVYGYGWYLFTYYDYAYSPNIYIR